jgi:hypothetical protein
MLHSCLDPTFTHVVVIRTASPLLQCCFAPHQATHCLIYSIWISRACTFHISHISSRIPRSSYLINRLVNTSRKLVFWKVCQRVAHSADIDNPRLITIWAESEFELGIRASWVCAIFSVLQSIPLDNLPCMPLTISSLSTFSKSSRRV